MNEQDATARRALFALLLATLLLALAVVRPLGSALFLAASLAMALARPHAWLTRRLRGRRAPAAGALTVLVVVLILGPLVSLSAFMVAEAADAADFVTDTLRRHGPDGLARLLPDGMEAQAGRVLSRLGTDLGQIARSLQGAGGNAAAAVGAAVSATGTLLFQGTMTVLALFFFLTDREELVDWLDEASPLRRGQTRELFGEFSRVCRAVVVSTLLTALAQSAAALAGYLLVGLPHPLFFFALTFVAAMIPVLGGAVVCVGAAGMLLFDGRRGAALFLAAYAVLVVGLSDNVVKPLLMKDDMRLHGAVVFFALIGGLAAFGGIGLLVGPIAAALFLTVFRMYQRDYAPRAETRHAMRRRASAGGP